MYIYIEIEREIDVCVYTSIDTDKGVAQLQNTRCVGSLRPAHDIGMARCA